MAVILSGHFSPEARALKDSVALILEKYNDALGSDPAFKKQLFKKIDDYLAGFKPSVEVIHRFKFGGEDKQDIVLLVPTNNARLCTDRAYLLYQKNEFGIRAYSVDHLPQIHEMVTNRQRLAELSPEEIQDEMDMPKRVSKALHEAHNGKGSLAPSSIHTLAKILDEKEILSVGEMARRDWSRQIAESVLSTDSDDFSFAAAEVKAMLDAHELEQLQPHIGRWLDEVALSSISIMRDPDMPKSIDFYNFLTPYSYRRIEVPHDKHPERTKSKSVREFDMDKAARRRDLVKQYPIAAWERFISKDIKELKEYDSGHESAERVLARHWKCREEDIARMSGLGRTDMGQAFTSFGHFAPTLQYLEQIDLPHSPAEWEAFLNIFWIDKRLHEKGLRRKGQTLTDIINDFDKFGNSWCRAEQFLSGESHMSDKIKQVEDTMMRVGKSIIVPMAWMALKNRGDAVKMPSAYAFERNIVPLCIPEDAKMYYGDKGTDFAAKKRLDDIFGKDRVSLVTELFEDETLFDLIERAQWFHNSEANQRYIEMRDTWALRMAMRESPLKYGWKELPEPEGQERLHLRGISNPAELHEAAEELQSRVVFMGPQAVTARKHFIRAVHPRTQMSTAVAVLQETEQDGVLRLSFNRNFDVFGPEDNAPFSNNAIEEIENYVARINGERIFTDPYDQRREKILERARNYGALRGLVGHDPDNATENRQAFEVLEQLLPEEMRRVDVGGTLHESRLSMKIINMARALDGKPALNGPLNAVA